MSVTLKTRKKIGMSVACGVIAVALSGCASERISGSGSTERLSQTETAGAAAAPLDQVSQSALPPLETSDYAAANAVHNDATGSIPAEPPADAVNVTPAGVAGVWNASVDGMKCRLVTPQTKAGQGYRAGALNCPSALAQAGSWNINGKQLLLFDKSGKNLAVLYSSSGGSFVGRSRTGASVALRR